MRITCEATKGIPHTNKPGSWIVPPWPVKASLSTVVGHFLRFRPRMDASTADQLVYYEGYQAAIAVAPTHELIYRCDLRWHKDLGESVARCIATLREQRAH